jgi:Fur family peroxide stress response transcriptional regulator
METDDDTSTESLSERSQRMLAGLRTAGFKLTAQRRAIVTLFADDQTHPTAQSIYERLRASHPTLSFATVYNTLDALSRAGTSGVLRVANAARFDPNTAPHQHAICDRCERIVDLPIESTEPSGTQRAEVERATGFAVRAVETTYRGICNTCRALDPV